MVLSRFKIINAWRCTCLRYRTLLRSTQWESVLADYERYIVISWCCRERLINSSSHYYLELQIMPQQGQADVDELCRRLR